MGRSLDERDSGGLPQLLTAAAVTTTQTATGHDALVHQARRRHSHGASIQHVITNLIVDLDGDPATGRAGRG